MLRSALRVEQCHGNYKEMKEFNYKLEIEIFRNSTQKNWMSWGVIFKGLGVQKGTQTPCWLRPWLDLFDDKHTSSVLPSWHSVFTLKKKTLSFSPFWLKYMLCNSCFTHVIHLNSNQSFQNSFFPGKRGRGAPETLKSTRETDNSLTQKINWDLCISGMPRSWEKCELKQASIKWVTIWKYQDMLSDGEAWNVLKLFQDNVLWNHRNCQALHQYLDNALY